MKYFFSHKTLGIGNVINCTPMLQSLAKHLNAPIPAFIDNPIAKACLKDAPFLELLDKKPEGDCIFHSRMYIQQKLTLGSYLMPDYEYIWTLGKKLFKYSGDMPHTYIDTPKALLPFDYVFINGSGCWKKDYLDKKIISNDIYRAIANRLEGSKVVLGSEYCNNPLKFAEDLRGSDIREQLGIIASAKMIITNEGGLAHAAAAMNKPTLILWKDTEKVKNMNPGTKTFYSFSDYVNDFKKFNQIY